MHSALRQHEETAQSSHHPSRPLMFRITPVSRSRIELIASVETIAASFRGPSQFAYRSGRSWLTRLP